MERFAAGPDGSGRLRRSETTPATGTDPGHSALHPGPVRINVQGAFVVDEESPDGRAHPGHQHITKDIRLPNHTAAISHVAVDVRPLFSFYFILYFSLHPFRY